MIFPKFKNKVFFITLLVLLFVSGKSFCDSIELPNNNIKYRIIDTQNDLINMSNTKAKIDTENRQITLEEITTLPDAIKFVGSKEDDNVHDFVVLEQGGMKYHAYTGSGEMPYIELPSLNVNVNIPLGIAINPLSQGSPSCLISYVLEGNEIRHFYYDDADGMKENSIITIAGLKHISSLSTFKESGDVALLTKSQFKLLNFSGELDRGVDFDFDVEEPLSIATGNGFNFSILTEESIQHYKYDGNQLSSIPILDIAISDSYEKPKSIVVDDNTNTTFLLSDRKVTKFKLNDTMNYSVTLAISDLINPVSMALNPETGGMLIIDNEIDDEFKAKYYMLNSSGKYIYNPSMSIMLGEMVTSNIVKRYRKEGVIELGTFVTSYDAKDNDLIRIRAYTETPKGTKIVFQISNSLDDFGEPLWYDSWYITNENNDDVNSGSLYKHTYEENVDYVDFYFGTNIHGYPTFNNKEYDYSNDDDLTIVDGEIPSIEEYITYENSLWTKLPTKNNKFNIRALMFSDNINHSPKIFAPIGTNNVSGLNDNDDVAIHIEVHKEPRKPVIIDVRDPWSIPAQEPKEDEFKFDPADEGWLYSTTPIVDWELVEIEEIEVIPIAFQVILIGDTFEGWATAYNSDLVYSSECSHFVPPSYDPNKAGFMWDIDAYEFGLAVRVMDEMGGVSDFSDIYPFKVLAFDRPRIANIIEPLDKVDIGGVEETIPIFDKKYTHKIIEHEYTINDLFVAKAGSQVTLLIDSVGPIKSKPLENSRFFVMMDGEEVPLIQSDSYAVNPLGMASNRNRWVFNFFTEAPITKIPDDTVILTRLAGVCDDFEDGGTTIFYIPDYSAGVVKTKDTTYSDWQVIIEGRDR